MATIVRGAVNNVNNKYPNLSIWLFMYLYPSVECILRVICYRVYCLHCLHLTFSQYKPLSHRLLTKEQQHQSLLFTLFM